MLKRLLLFIISILLPTLGMADYYVSTTGNDNNRGNKDAPFRTISKALSVVPLAGGVHIYIGAGIYNENSSGLYYLNLKYKYQNPVTISALDNYTVVIEGYDGRNNYNVVAGADCNNIEFQGIIFPCVEGLANGGGGSLYPIEFSKTIANLNNIKFKNCWIITNSKLKNSMGIRMVNKSQQSIILEDCTWVVYGYQNTNDPSAIGLYVQGPNLNVLVVRPTIKVCNGKGLWISGGVGNIYGGSLQGQGNSPVVLYGLDSSTNSNIVYGSIVGTNIDGPNSESLVIGAGTINIQLSNIIVNGSELVLKSSNGTIVRGIITKAISAGLLFKGAVGSDIGGSTIISGSAIYSDYDGVGNLYTAYNNNIEYCQGFTTGQGNVYKWDYRGERIPYGNRFNHNTQRITGKGNYGLIGSKAKLINLSQIRNAWQSTDESQQNNDFYQGNIRIVFTSPITNVIRYVIIKDGVNGWNVTTNRFEPINPNQWMNYCIPLCEEPDNKGTYSMPLIPEIIKSGVGNITINHYSTSVWGYQSINDIMDLSESKIINGP